MKRKSIIHVLGVFFCCSGLIACGGGGSEDKSNTIPTQKNSSPTVNAGVDQSIEENLIVTLNGSASDSDGSIASYSWSQTEGTNVTLENADSVTATFTAPEVSINETLTFQLLVTDNDGATSTDSIIITVLPVPSLSDIIQLNISGKTQVFITQKSYVQTDNSAPKSYVQPDNSPPLNEFTAFSQSITNVSENTVETTNTNTNTSNFFTFDSDGKMNFAATSEYSFEVSYSMITKQYDENGVIEEYLIFAIDPGSMISDEFISATDNCAIFKGKISDDSVSCLVPNIKAENNNSSHWQNQRKLNHKPIQMTDEGTLFVYGSTFGLDQNYSNTLFKVKPDGVLQNVIGDDVTLYSFISLDSNSIVYQSSDGLKMLTDLDSDTVSTIDVSSNSSGIFTVDDHQTLIHQNNSSLSFTKASKVQVGTNEISGARTKSIINAPSNLIFADDGGIYGFESNNFGGDITLQRILPYSEDTFATCEMNGDAVQSFSDPIQISKGYAFCIGSENLNGVGDRNIINVVRMIDGIKITLLNDENWEQRYSISSWRLSNDVLYFSGFDKTTSTMISGELDVIGLKQSNEGDPESIYLSINQSASIVDENIVISDREFLVASVPENHTGGTPAVLEYYTHENNNSSISIEFNKGMNPQSVDENISLYSIDKYDFKYTIPTINVWLGRRLHMMTDNNVSFKVTAEMKNFDAFFAEYQVGSDYVVQDLLENTEYTIAMLSGAFDLDEIPIEPSVKSFTTGDNLDLGFQNIDPLDFDGDKIPNYLEDLLGLDIFDPADGSDDLDGDGYTNTEEASTGSDLNDENSVPDIIGNGFTELFYNSGDFKLEGNLELDLNSSKDSDGGSILFPYVYPYDSADYLYFSAYFDDGVLSFYVGDATVWETFTIILDGDSLLDTPLTPSYTCDRVAFEVSGILWHKCELEIARGYHEIKWQNQSAGFNLKLDNVEFNQN